jgi:GTP-binding protein
MLVDTAEITIRGGHGGTGMPKKLRGPDGGNGGKGGDVYINTSSNVFLLGQFSEKDVFVAESGQMGSRNNKTGKNGKDIEILLPAGTQIIDKKTKEILVELTKPGERILICRGGKGGMGNNEDRRGDKGEEKKLKLSLRLIADMGLIGLPNVGKSSLLNEITNAKATIANYPFTTLEPNLGMFEGKTLADIPGLIEGASTGKGLGIAFLKHIEKVSVLLHCISSDSPDPLNDYKTVRKELKEFKQELIKKPEVIILTKTDLIDETLVKKQIKKLSKITKKVIPVSIHDSQSLEELKKVLRNIVE